MPVFYGMVLKSGKIIKKDRELIPYLRHSKTHREIIESLENRKNAILLFDWSVEEFKLLNDLNLSKLFGKAIENNRTNLVIYLSSRYRNPINLQLNATSDTISSYLDGNDMVTIYIEDPDVDVLKMFLIPCPLIEYLDDTDSRLLYERYLSGMSDKELLFWSGADSNYLKKIKLWSLVSRSYIDTCRQKGDSFPMLINWRNLLYPSMRPQTDMSLFQTSLSNYYSSTDEIPGKYIRVTRYSKGMSKGLYHDERPSDVCGYFYYNEPQSSTCLTYTNAFTSFNKTTAVNELLDRIPEDDKNFPEFSKFKRDIIAMTEFKELMDHISGRLPPDLKMTAYDFDKYNKNNPDSNYKEGVYESNRKVYCGMLLNLYAEEDILDQQLCKMASKLGYDIVILTHMVGSHQVVTEILDTRNNSFDHIWFKK